MTNMLHQDENVLDRNKCMIPQHEIASDTLVLTRDAAVVRTIMLKVQGCDTLD